MANRKHVIDRRLVAATLLVLVLMAGCDAAPPSPIPTESRGRVIDEETGKGIPGALVVGRYMGSIAWAGSSCDRIESATSDHDGWFTIPNDSHGKSPFLEAYHRGYGRGSNPRYAVGLSAEPPKWQVWDQRRNVNGDVVSLVKEPTIYRTQREALEASRQWRDVYLRPFRGAREERLMSLSVQAGAGSCDRGPQTTSGAIDFLEAILQEEIELAASESELRHTRSIIETALLAKAADMARDAAKSK